jgi:tRNA (mo5U34)-methyltransferase
VPITIDDLRRRFRIEDETVSALPAGVDHTVTSQQRVKAWRKLLYENTDRVTEYLVPRIVRPIDRQWPAAFMTPRVPPGDETERAIEELGPWNVPYHLGGGRSTRRDTPAVAASFWSYRVDLLNSTVHDLLGADLADSTVLDIASGPGYFALDMAARGAHHVDGMDLREKNIAQARFMADYYGIDNATFSVGDVDEFSPDRRWDVVLSYGLLYHLVDPVGHVRQLHDLCTRFAVIDTNCAREPFSGYLLLGDKDTSRPVEGREHFELHPTYRGLIDTIRLAGFREVVELVGVSEEPHPHYAAGNRRAMVAIK